MSIDTQPVTGRKERKAQTRQLLKEAAADCFASGGLEGTSIGAITRRAGVAHGTFYVHFPTKEAVLDELLADFNQDLLARLVAAWDELPADDLPALVQRTAEVFLDSWYERRDFVAAYAQRLTQGLEPAALRDGINPQVAGLLLSRLGSLPSVGDPLDVLLVGQGLLSMWSRIGLQFLFRDDVDRARALATLVPMTLGALGVPR